MPDLRKELNSRILGTVLSCPVCGAPLCLSEDGGSLLCTGAVSERNPRGRAHCFDGGKGGYLPLSPRHSGGGDSKENVRARTAFLESGYYAPAAKALVALADEYTPADGIVLDAGCGEGYYSNQLAEAHPVCGVDLSKFAVDAAARAAGRIRGDGESRTVFAVGSVFELPVRSASVDTVTNIFAPCAPAEYARVLKPGGCLIVAGAGETHLFGLKKQIYDNPYLNDPRRDLPEGDEGFELIDRQNVSFTITVGCHEHVEALFSMTPYYWRTSADGHSRLSALHTLETEVSFDFHVYRRL